MNNLNKLYISKNLEYSSNIRKEILDVIPKFSKRILDLGCGNGSTCKWLKENNYCETTYGIEKFNINQIEIKQNIDFFCEANLETDDFFPNVKFRIQTANIDAYIYDRIVSPLPFNSILFSFKTSFKKLLNAK